MTYKRTFKKSARVLVECDVIRETDKALLIRQGSIEEWIPRSLCHHISKRPVAARTDVPAVITMDQWIADDRGLDSEETE
jgi:hypothetical protein